MSELIIENVWKEYGDQIVLENVSLTIASRAFVALVGPSGCGKTTFLRMLLGQERPTRGTILLDGQPIPTEPGRDRGVVFQRYSVFPHLTVLGNVLLGKEFSNARYKAKLFGAARRNAIEEARTAHRRGWACRVRNRNIPHSFQAACSSVSRSPKR